MMSLRFAAYLLPLALLACKGSDPAQPASPPTSPSTAPTAAREAVQPDALKLANFYAPMPGIWTAGQPTEEQFARLPAADFKHVIHLRLASEKGSGWEEAKATELGLHFTRLPIDGDKGLTLDNVKKFAELLGETKGEGTLVSCGSSNRVGALFALKAYWLDGKSAEEAMAVGKSAGLTKLEPKVKELLAQPK